MFEGLSRWLTGSPLSPAELGKRGERRAGWYLRVRGFRILARNLRTPVGEIDLVALRGSLLVFVEVKARQTRTSGRPHDAVNSAKQVRLARLAERFLAEHGADRKEVRFDVISLFWSGRRFELTHFPDAFRPQMESGRPWKISR